MLQNAHFFARIGFDTAEKQPAKHMQQLQNCKHVAKFEARFQYYRAQCVCPETDLENWMEHRARGTCHLDILPDRDVTHCRQ